MKIREKNAFSRKWSPKLLMTYPSILFVAVMVPNFSFPDKNLMSYANERFGNNAATNERLE